MQVRTYMHVGVGFFAAGIRFIARWLKAEATCSVEAHRPPKMLPAVRRRLRGKTTVRTPFPEADLGDDACV